MVADNDTMHVLGTTIKILTRFEGDRDLHLSEMTVPQGTGAPPHRHPWDETFYVVSGCVALLVESESHELTPGAFIRIPGGTLHAFTGMSEEPAVLLETAPRAAEIFFRDMDANIQVMPDDAPKAIAIGQRHQVTIVLPDSK